MDRSRPAGLLDAQRAELLDLAIGAVGTALRVGCRRAPDLAAVSAGLREPGASFVTLLRDGRLLGCIGSIEPVRPLAVDVAENAVGAAFGDPRLPAVTNDDYRTMDVKVSVLSPMTLLPVTGLVELADVVRPGIDGLLLTSAGGRGTFLPSVWDQVPGVVAFLDALWQKAGLAPRSWPDDLVVHRYTTDEFTAPGPRPMLAEEAVRRT